MEFKKKEKTKERIIKNVKKESVIAILRATGTGGKKGSR